MNIEEHKARHQLLLKELDELVADFIIHTNSLPSRTTIMELMEWSYIQTTNPACEDKEGSTSDSQKNS